MLVPAAGARRTHLPPTSAPSCVPAAQHESFLQNFTSQFTKTCYGYSSHYDTSLQNELPRGIMSQALTLVSLRHPVDRFISEFKHTRDVLFR
jgi:hypothetical protein